MLEAIYNLSVTYPPIRCSLRKSQIMGKIIRVPVTGPLPHLAKLSGGIYIDKRAQLGIDLAQLGLFNVLHVGCF